MMEWIKFNVFWTGFAIAYIYGWCILFHLITHLTTLHWLNATVIGIFFIFQNILWIEDRFFNK